MVKDAKEINKNPNVVKDLEGWTRSWKKSVAVKVDERAVFLDEVLDHVIDAADIVLCGDGDFFIRISQGIYSQSQTALGTFASEMKRIMMEGVEVNGKQMYLSNFGINTLNKYFWKKYRLRRLM